ncbi:MAG: site-2 protease family protein [Opitutaceae bacterium]|jgi:Zn-dependent protease
MLGWSINLFRVRGIQLTLHFSFVILPAYAAYVGYQEAGMAGLVWSVALLLAFFVCVVLHEFGHSLVAIHFGVGVSRILLLPIGGMAQFDSIPRQPSRELLITVAGPAVNFAIAAILLPFVSFPKGWLLSSYPSSAGDFARYILVANLIMGVFNLLPAFPMDGGRILRAVLATRLPYLRATFWAATTGKVISFAGFAAAIWAQSYFLAALFAFIFFVGEAEYRALLRRDREDARWRRVLAEYEAIRTAIPPSDEPPLLTK